MQWRQASSACLSYSVLSPKALKEIYSVGEPFLSTPRTKLPPKAPFFKWKRRFTSTYRPFNQILTPSHHFSMTNKIAMHKNLENNLIACDTTLYLFKYRLDNGAVLCS
jgi:hypothetical protein